MNPAYIFASSSCDGVIGQITCMPFYAIGLVVLIPLLAAAALASSSIAIVVFVLLKKYSNASKSKKIVLTLLALLITMTPATFLILGIYKSNERQKTVRELAAVNFTLYDTIIPEYKKVNVSVYGSSEASVNGRYKSTKGLKQIITVQQSKATQYNNLVCSKTDTMPILDSQEKFYQLENGKIYDVDGLGNVTICYGNTKMYFIGAYHLSVPQLQKALINTKKSSTEDYIKS